MDKQKKTKFEEIDVERINVVDQDGNLRMALFNTAQMPKAIINGETMENRSFQGSGVLFYNGEGDECGGLIYDSKKDENGNYHSFASLTFDQYHNDQVLQLNSFERNGKRNYGFSISDQPGHIGRAWMAKGDNGSVNIALADSKGQERIRMSIDSNDVPRMDFLNDKGEVIYSLPPEQ